MSLHKVGLVFAALIKRNKVENWQLCPPFLQLMEKFKDFFPNSKPCLGVDLLKHCPGARTHIPGEEDGPALFQDSHHPFHCAVPFKKDTDALE